MKCLTIFLIILGLIWGGDASTTNKPNVFGFYFSDFKAMYSVYKECANKELTLCLKLKLITAIDRAARLYPTIHFINGITFIKRDDVEDVPLKSAIEIENSLPRSFSAKNSVLNQIIFDQVGQFFESYTLQVNFPTRQKRQQRSSFTGRQGATATVMPGTMDLVDEDKSGTYLLLVPLMIASILGPLSVGGLALVAGKALLIGKIALVLSAIVGLKSLFHAYHGGTTTHHHIHGSSSHEYSDRRRVSDWSRSYDTRQQQPIAYNSYTPQK